MELTTAQQRACLIDFCVAINHASEKQHLSSFFATLKFFVPTELLKMTRTVIFQIFHDPLSLKLATDLGTIVMQVEKGEPVDDTLTKLTTTWKDSAGDSLFGVRLLAARKALGVVPLERVEHICAIGEQLNVDLDFYATEDQFSRLDQYRDFFTPRVIAVLNTITLDNRLSLGLLLADMVKELPRPHQENFSCLVAQTWDSTAAFQRALPAFLESYKLGLQALAALQGEVL